MTGRTQTRTIRRRVLSAHTELVVVGAKIAAVHHDSREFRWLATASILPRRSALEPQAVSSDPKRP